MQEKKCREKINKNAKIYLKNKIISFFFQKKILLPNFAKKKLFFLSIIYYKKTLNSK
jgi:hypothetical protein